MKFSSTLIAVTAAGQCAHAAVVPIADDVQLLSWSSEDNSYSKRSESEELWKRKGGGGSGGRGSSSGSSGSSGSGSSSSGSSSGRSGSSGSSSSSGSSGGSSSSSPGSSGSRGGSSSSSSGSSSSSSSTGSGRGSSGSSSSGLGSSSSSSGGRTTTGSGVKPSYGSGGRYYSGGATQPYRAGSPSVGSGIVPGLFLGSALGFWGAYWLVGAYHYPYHSPYNFRNSTTNQNETKPVECLCKADEECGCEDNSSDESYMSSIIGNGSYNGLNQSVVTVANVNGTDTIFINGTLANGTTASGGTDDPNAAGSMKSLLQAAGWWPLAATALALAYVA